MYVRKREREESEFPSDIYGFSRTEKKKKRLSDRQLLFVL